MRSELALLAVFLPLALTAPALAAPPPPISGDAGGMLGWIWPSTPPGTIPPTATQGGESTFPHPVVSRQDVGGVPIVTMEFAQLDPALGGGAESVQSRGFFGKVVDTISYGFASVYHALTSGLTPPSPSSFAKKMKSKDPYDFWQLIGDAGYKLKEIQTQIGIVPDVEFKFRYVRELSNGDINWLERKLAKHAAKFSDPVSLIQRTIIYSLLEINSSDTYFVEELKVDLLPLPRAVFVLSPWEAGLNREHDELLRAIQGKSSIMRKTTEEDSHY